MRTVLALARCSHLGPTVAVTVFATLLAVTAGKGTSALLVGAAVLAGQLSVGWSNDWLDRERDRAVDRADKPLVSGDIADTTLAAAAGLAVLVCVGLSLANGLIAGVLHLAAVAAAWSYNLVVKRTPLSPLPYLVAFGLLPAFITLARPEPAAPPMWIVAAGAALGAAAHFTNVLPDLETDAATGVRGLPHRMGRRASLIAAALLVAAALAMAAIGPPRRPPVLGAALSAAGFALVVGVVVAGMTGHGRLAFNLVIAAAGASVLSVLVVGL